MKKFFLLVTLLLVCLTPRAFAYTVTGAELQAIAIEALENALAQRGETRRHEIIFTQSPPDVKLPEGEVEVRTNLPAQISYISLTPVRATIYVSGRAFRTVAFTASVKVYETVLVASHDLRIEVPVTASDFHAAEVAVDGRNEFVKDVNEIVGLVPHRFIRGGSPISKGYFQQPVAVNSGQRVTIVLNWRGIRASARGIALTRGRVGSLIKVKNEISEKVLTAKVIDSQTVEVSM